MQCAKPLPAWRSKHRSPGGAWPVVFNLTDGWKDKPVDVPCGRCMPCRINKAETWANRLEHEAAMHTDSQFLTLTYEEMPENGSLQPRDATLFVKRLREHLSRLPAEPKIRYFLVGEYGDRFARPHFHVLMFGYRFTDLASIRTGKMPLHTSAELQRIWGHGFVTIGQVTPQSIRYCAAYITKRITGPMADKHYQGRVPEFARMSRRPGIGSSWAAKYAADLFPNGHLTLRGGAKMPLPRIYLDAWAKDHQAEARELQARKQIHASVHAKTYRERRTKETILISKARTRQKGSL